MYNLNVEVAGVPPFIHSIPFTININVPTPPPSVVSTSGGGGGVGNSSGLDPTIIIVVAVLASIAVILIIVGVLYYCRRRHPRKQSKYSVDILVTFNILCRLACNISTVNQHIVTSFYY